MISELDPAVAPHQRRFLSTSRRFVEFRKPHRWVRVRTIPARTLQAVLTRCIISCCTWRSGDATFTMALPAFASACSLHSPKINYD